MSQVRILSARFTPGFQLRCARNIGKLIAAAGAPAALSMSINIISLGRRLPYSISVPQIGMSGSESNDREQSLLAAAAAATVAQSDALRRLKILIVDDQPSDVELLERCLAEEQFENFISTTDSGRAIELFQELRPDLVLIDWLMPPESGLPVIKQLRALIGSEGYLPIVVLTADASKQTRLEALAAGATDFLRKPLDAIEVMLRICNLLLVRLCRQQQQSLEEAAQERTASLEQMVEASKTSEAFFQSLFHPLPVYIFRKDAEGRFTFVNERFCQRQGKSRAEILGQTDFDINPADMAQKYRENDPLEHAECPIDMQRLRDVSGDTPEHLREIVGLYLSEASALIPQLQAAVQAGQAEKIERLAHRLVGASANCGIISIVAPLRELERMGRSHRLDGAERLSTAVTDQFELVEQFLTSLLSEGDDSWWWSRLAE
jgi:CheY-like chemotaxis protein